jgi:hypothetical protein
MTHLTTQPDIVHELHEVPAPGNGVPRGMLQAEPRVYVAWEVLGTP